MRLITTQNIKARKSNMSSLPYNESHTYSPNIISTNFDRLVEIGYSRVVAENVITQMPKYNNSDFAFRQILEVFDMVCQHENASYITKTANMICEAIVPKTRTGAETKKYLKMKVARFKTKLHTKFKNNVEDIKGAAGNTVADIKKNLNNNVSSIKSNVDKGLVKKEQAIEDAYDKIYESYQNIIECDRVLSNQIRLEKYYKLNEVVSLYYDNPRQAIVEMCAMIDSFNMATSLKYNVSLENTLYTFAENNIKIDPKLILETVTDYYLVYTNPLTEDVKINMQSIYETNSLFTSEDKSCLDDTFKDIAKLDIKFDDTFTLLTEKPDISKYMSEMDMLRHIVESSEEENKVKVLFNKFKLEAQKTPDKLKDLVYKFYVQSPDQILEELPNFLSWIRMFFIVGGAVAISPILGVVALISDQALKITLSRKQLTKYIEKYKKELDKTNKDIEKAKTKETKDRLEAYKKQLEKSIEKLQNKEDTLYTEKENDDRHADDYDLGDEDLFDFDFNESFMLATYGIKCIEAAIDEFVDCENLTESIISNYKKYDPSAISLITEYLLMYPEAANTVLIANEFLSFISENSKYNGDIIDMKVALNKAAKELLDIDTMSIYTDDYGFSAAFRLENATDGYKAILSYTNSVSTLQEMDVVNTMKMAKEGLKKSIQGISDKEKAMSRNVDVACDQVKNSAEKAMMNGNREAVIRGSLLPSASKIIKTAIISGAGWAINPAVTVIGLLGYIGISKKLQAKERQLILDDIEIELSMCDRYIKIAEDNNDMKAQRSLLITKRSLERQRQRIKYKMIVYHNQKVDTKKHDDEDYD